MKFKLDTALAVATVVFFFLPLIVEWVRAFLDSLSKVLRDDRVRERETMFYKKVNYD